MQNLSVELVNTGTELLLGSVINTNAAWIGEQLFERGIRVARQVTVPDGEAIGEALREAACRSGVVLVSGGLGPTSDDVTREALAALCGVPLRADPAILAHLTLFFEKRGLPMSPANERQALVPEGAVVLDNDYGTAPGLWMPADESAGRGHVFLLPGPPRELNPMMERHVLPHLASMAGASGTGMKVLKVVGIGESNLQDMVDAPLADVNGLEVGYCARLGEVDVRLIGRDDVIGKGVALLEELIDGYIVKPYGATLEEAVVRFLKQKGWTLATAESCTGGLIAKRITDVSGASGVFHYGFVTYANEAKTSLLGVPGELFMQHGAVSEEVAAAMAEGALTRSGADVAVAVTGVAGPTGGTVDKPAGTVWLAWAFRNGRTETKKRFFPVDREAFRQLVSQYVLARLLWL